MKWGKKHKLNNLKAEGLVKFVELRPTAFQFFHDTQVCYRQT